MIATDQQVQEWFAAVRTECQHTRARFLNAQAIKLAVDDVYNNLNQGSPTFVDSRTDVPEKATPAMGLSYNAFLTALLAILNGSGENDATKAGYVQAIRDNYGTVQRLCVGLPVP